MRRLSKSIVAGLAAILLLLCQTAYAAGTCRLLAGDAGDNAVSQACHDMDLGTESSPSPDDHKGQCASPGTVRAAVDFSLEVMSAPLASVPRAVQQYLAPRMLPAASSGMMTASSPSLPIIHCRLLI